MCIDRENKRAHVIYKDKKRCLVEVNRVKGQCFPTFKRPECFWKYYWDERECTW